MSSKQQKQHSYDPPGEDSESYKAGCGQTATVKIADIVERKDWQIRAATQQRTVMSYATVFKGGGEMPPVTVANVGGTLVLVDGYHRIAALRAIGRAVVKAEIVSASEEDARWMAVTANLTHGLPLKPRELRNAFKTYVRAGQHRKGRRYFKSYREMAGDFMNRVSHTTIRNWMMRHFPKTAQRIGGGMEHGLGPYSGGNGPHFIPETALSRALQNLDAACNEARTLSPRERGELIARVGRIKDEIEKIGPWDPYSDALDDNDDF